MRSACVGNIIYYNMLVHRQYPPMVNIGKIIVLRYRYRRLTAFANIEKLYLHLEEYK